MSLSLKGHEVQTANDGMTALQLAHDYRPDGILMDIGLPGLNGYQLAERFRRTPDLQDVALIAVTGYGQPEDRQRSKQAGFDYHMVKPVDHHELDRVLTQNRAREAVKALRCHELNRRYARNG
jgi:CheY-like chemotaxis protein